MLLKTSPSLINYFSPDISTLVTIPHESDAKQKFLPEVFVYMFAEALSDKFEIIYSDEGHFLNLLNL